MVPDLATLEANKDGICVLRLLERTPSDLIQDEILSSEALPVLLLDVGVKEAAGSCRGIVKCAGSLAPLSRLRILGNGMLESLLTQQAIDKKINGDSRLQPVLGTALDSIRHSRVTIVGVSRTGNEMAWQLTALGVSCLTLIDPKTIAVHHLDQLPVLHTDIGRPKVSAIAEHLHRLRPQQHIRALPLSGTSREARLSLIGSDLIVTCCDEGGSAARLVAAEIASNMLIPHLDIGTGIHNLAESADVRLFLPRQGCITCSAGGLPNVANAKYELAGPDSALRRGRHQPWSDLRDGSLITLNHLAVSTAVRLWIDMLQGRLTSTFWCRLIWQPGNGLITENLFANANPACLLCNPS